MNNICGDNRFELIEKYKKLLVEATNIETSPEEMKVIDTILFRFWQMGWLDKLEKPVPKSGKWVGVSPMVDTMMCSECGENIISKEFETPYCPNCGANMESEE